MLLPRLKTVWAGLLLLPLIACTSKPAAGKEDAGGPASAPTSHAAQPEAGPRAQAPAAAVPLPPSKEDAGPPAAPAAEPAPGTPTPPTAAEGEFQVLIWGGGRTAQEAQAALDAFETEREALQRLITLGGGFPKIIESQTMPGLNPGFHVVVLGLCTPEEAKEPLAILQAFKSGVYARTVRAQAVPDSCPKVEHGLKIELVERLEKKPYELTAVHLKSKTEEPVIGVPWLLRLYLRDATGKLVDWTEEHPRDARRMNAECTESVEADKPFIVFSATCMGAGEAGELERWTEEIKYRIGEGKIEQLK